ncbi:Phytochrome-like protein cph1 [Vibrio ruber DSM 16370]|uniref:histidine kinase n=1 Tax=Vibrio ruber (strain DSM 16370 / JCM 11486 / BCRC 17186 / CECT 7878 / LMG 23124 / VR1) TaxID=1123498 RepID=A0A1R4LAW3_VIBR1|nr:CHASE domain-containing protein [Vibrio ruber]SJN53678.1 Phytochrome-like protein cph1 [Vibrio ruber DSM 16370]
MSSQLKDIKYEVKGVSTGLHWYHWVVISLSLVLTFGAYYITERQTNLKIATQFEFQSQQIVELVQERMIRYEEALWAGVSALKMFPSDASREDWRTFAASLQIDQRFPGINGIGVIHYVPSEKLSNYLAWQRASMPDYGLHPAHSEPEYWPITYIEPQSENRRAVGLDMAHEINRYTAAKKARDTRHANITGPITLVQDDQKTPGFLFYAPWHSSSRSSDRYGGSDSEFKGLVYAPFIMYKLMDGTLKNVNRLVNFSIHDGDTLLYSELDSNSENLDADPLFQREITLELYGRLWRFHLQSTQLFRAQQNYAQPLIILFGGLMIDVLLFAIFFVLARSNRNAVEYAQKVTASLKLRQEELEQASQNLQQKNRDLQEANNELDQFAFVASHDLKAPLRGINQLAQWIEEDSEGALTDTTYTHLTLMKSRIARLESLLDDLLTYSRVGRNKELPNSVQIAPMIDDIFHLLNHDGRFSLTLEAPTESVMTITTPLEQILRNLIGNAMKHHDQDTGNIAIHVSQLSQYLHFEVKDDGPGIPVEHQQQVFELFHTLRPRDQVEGSGMGLSIIKKILERYHCTYQIQSDGQRGLVFSFYWPIGMKSHNTEDDERDKK